MWRPLRFLLLFCSAFSAFSQVTNYPVTANMDTGPRVGKIMNVWYERGFNPSAPDTGLPPAVVPFYSQTHSNRLYHFQDYTGTNALLLTSRTAEKSGRLLLDAPTNYTRLSVAASAAWGEVNLYAIIHYETGAKQTNAIRVDDWYGSTNAIWTAHGRFDMATGKFDQVSTNSWKIYAIDLNVTNTTASVTQIEFVYRNSPGNGHAAIFGVSGTRSDNFAPVPVSGFNHDMVIEASFDAHLLPNLYCEFLTGTLKGSPGENFFVSLRFGNFGSDSSPPTEAALFVVPRSEPSSPPRKIAELSVPALLPIQAARHTNLNFEVTVPADVALGIYDLVLRIDPDSEVEEMNEEDNSQLGYLILGPNFAMIPDGAFVYNDGLAAWLVFQQKVYNEGISSTQEVSGELWIEKGTTNEMRLVEFIVPVLTNPAIQLVDLRIPLPGALQPGTFDFTVVLDPENIIPEAVEVDNLLTRDFTLQTNDFKGIATFSIALPQNGWVSLVPRTAVNVEVIGSTNLVDWYHVDSYEAHQTNSIFGRVTVESGEFFRLRYQRP